ncbi:hypothetical protein [Streptomyces sp. V3I7]|uniref:hypothetical protein n=1 Tax=Streptomyces sp. V3I7 TaxID=3042278 RepID=UPI0027D8AB33|nr:hypothetical protein [Streptomyces sp. V3I7]
MSGLYQRDAVPTSPEPGSVQPDWKPRWPVSELVETTLPSGSYDAEPASVVAPEANVPTTSLCWSVRASTAPPTVDIG